MTGGAGAAGAPVLTYWIGRLSGEASPFQVPRRFVLAGVDWQGPAQTSIELRARLVTGRWTPWVRASVLGHDSDRRETIAHALVGEPVWTGPADAVQLRAAGAVAGLNLHLVLAAAVKDPGAGAVERRGDAGDAAASTAQGLPLALPRLPAGPGQPAIIARRAWAGALLPRTTPAYGSVRMAFVHHSVNANGYSSAEVPAMLRSIYVFHTYVRGWNDIGYNFAVDAFGRIWEARAGGIDRPVVGAQAGGYNLESFGAVLLGDFSATLPTAAARDALAHLIAWKMVLHGVPITGHVTVEVDPPDAYYTRFRPGQQVSLPRIAGHRDGCTTDCPGEDMYVSGMPPLRKSVRQITGRQVALTLAVGPPPGAAYALAPYPIARGTRVTPATFLDLQTVKLSVGRQLPLHGFLRTFAGAGLKSAPIVLQDLGATRRDESARTLATARTRHDGLWVALLKPRSNFLLRALHADAPAAVSALIAIGVKPELDLAVASAGGEVRVSGTVTPAKDRIVVEARSMTGLRRVVERIAVEAGGGSFATTIRLAPGSYWVTASTQADVTNVAGESAQVAAHI